ncbi:hypothetical protein [Prevotella dentasini]|uniref:hypothetical protein n=1 Tax=Prevotella dentasini TaxID=589537 RepID=UPI0004684FFC|nr:hypothetical protein [Prevotella dentasini]
MLYEEDILRILVEAGETGLPVRKISRHVFNARNSFFNPITEEEVHQFVCQYLGRVCKNEDSLIERTQKGVYRLNDSNKDSRQLYLQFRDDGDEPAEPKKEIDQSLSLF